MSGPDQIKAREELRKKLMDDVVNSGVTYAVAISELGYVQTVLRDKGDNLLNSVSVQEVAKQSSRYNAF